VRHWLILCMLAWATGCAESQQYFRPTEHVYGETPQGYHEAIYTLVGPFGPFGEAKLWSGGAFREHGQTVVHASLDLHNTSGAPIVIDPANLRLDPVRIGSSLLRDLPPVESRRLSVAPGAFGTVRMTFLLPPEVMPGEVSSFGLNWKVVNGPQSYVQRTPFTEEYRSYAYAYPPSYGWGYGYYCTVYDPFCRGAYPGLGVGVYVGPRYGGGGRGRVGVHHR
jgi:hypothetical protein